MSKPFEKSMQRKGFRRFLLPFTIGLVVLVALGAILIATA